MCAVGTRRMINIRLLISQAEGARISIASVRVCVKQTITSLALPVK